MTWKDLLGLTVLGACVTTLGSLLATVIKEFVATRWLERWKSRQTLQSVYRKYQLPIFLAAEELGGRLYGLSRPDNDRAEREIGLEQFRSQARREFNITVSEHYLKYRFFSNVYRLCSFLCWVELYRRDIGSLDPELLDRNRRLDECLRAIQGVFADGWINQHDDWQGWKDCLIYREEQRAIGTVMALSGDALRVLDFGRFTEVIEKDPEGGGAAKWLVQAAHFFAHLGRDDDFRIVRMRMLVTYLTDLMLVLRPKQVDPSYIDSANRYRSVFNAMTGGSEWKSSALPQGELPVHVVEPSKWFRRLRRSGD